MLNPCDKRMQRVNNQINLTFEAVMSSNIRRPVCSTNANNIDQSSEKKIIIVHRDRIKMRMTSYDNIIHSELHCTI